MCDGFKACTDMELITNEILTLKVFGLDLILLPTLIPFHELLGVYGCVSF